MSSRVETVPSQSKSRPLAERVSSAIERDDRISSSHQVYSPPTKRRAPDIIQFMVEKEAYDCSYSDSVDTVGVSVPQLANSGRFTVCEDTLRGDLQTLVTYGYLEVDTSGSTHWYTIADVWVHPDSDSEEPSAHADSEPVSDPVGSDSEHVDSQYPARTGHGEKNYERVRALFKHGASNLTAKQQLTASVFGHGSLVVAVLAVALAVGGGGISPHLAAACGPLAKASATLLVGWVWLQFVGQAGRRMDERQGVPS